MGFYVTQATIKALHDGVAAEKARKVAEKASEATKRAELKKALEEQMKLNATKRCVAIA